MNIDNLKMLNNKNTNRYNCGILQISNENNELNILDSKFNNNYVSRNGGAL